MSDQQQGPTTWPKYDPEKVGGALLFEIVDHYPSYFRIEELFGRVVADRKDAREWGAASAALRRLRQAGLIDYGFQGVVEPTEAARLAHSLFLLE